MIHQAFIQSYFRRSAYYNGVIKYFVVHTQTVLTRYLLIPNSKIYILLQQKSQLEEKKRPLSSNIQRGNEKSLRALKVTEPKVIIKCLAFGSR